MLTLQSKKHCGGTTRSVAIPVLEGTRCLVCFLGGFDQKRPQKQHACVMVMVKLLDRPITIDYMRLDVLNILTMSFHVQILSQWMTKKYIYLQKPTHGRIQQQNKDGLHHSVALFEQDKENSTRSTREEDD